MVHVLDDVKAARMKARTMLIPHPSDVQRAISEIPAGETKSIRVLRTEMAHAAGADITCPMVAGIFWRVVADLAEEERAEGKAELAPWWRVTLDGKPNPKLPNGVEYHRALLAAEGVRI